METNVNLKTWGFSRTGEVIPVNINVTLIRRLPSIVVVGLAESSARETAERVRSACLASGFELPRQRIVITVKAGPPFTELAAVREHLDLPIALAILVAAGHLTMREGNRIYPVGMLALDGTVRPTRGMVALAAAMRIPDEIALPGEAAVYAAPYTWARNVPLANSLQNVVAILGGEVSAWTSVSNYNMGMHTPSMPLDMQDIFGNTNLMGKLAACAATCRPVVLRGPPGCGKTMLAARLAALRGGLTTDEEATLACIYDMAGLPLHGRPMRPFRAPHHSISVAGLCSAPIGALASNPLRPSESELAAFGVLFTDECVEFPRINIETLASVISMMGVARRPWWVAACNPGPGRGGARLEGPLDGVQEAYDKRIDRVMASMKLATGQEPLLIDLEPVSRATLQDPAARWPSTASMRLLVAMCKENAELCGRLLHGEPEDKSDEAFIRRMVDRTPPVWKIE